MTICTRCGGTMVERLVRFSVADASPPFFVDDTPALVCENCGERAYADATVAILGRVRQGDRPQPLSIAVDLYSFTSLTEHKVSMHRTNGAERRRYVRKSRVSKG